MDRRKVIKNHLQFTRGAVKKILGNFNEEESMHQIHPVANHVRWQTGHMIGAAYAMLRILGEKLQEPEGTEELFGSGSELKTDPDVYPAQTELRQQLYKLWDRISDRLDRVDDSLFDETVDFAGEWQPTKYEALMFLAAHDFYHAGQAVQTMRSLGKDRPFS